MKLTSLEVRENFVFSGSDQKRSGEAVFTGAFGKVALTLTDQDIVQLEAMLAERLAEVKKELNKQREEEE